VAIVTDLELPAFEYYDPELRGQRFQSVMSELAASGEWLAQMPLGFVVLEREAGEFFLRSKSFTFPGRKVAEIFGVNEGPLYEAISRNILCIDGADHRRLRNLVNPALTPRAVERYRPAMRRFIEELFEPVAAAGRCEFVEEVAKPYPSLTIATVMGAPLADAPRLYHWSNVIQQQFASNLLDERAQIEQAVVEFYFYARGLVEARRSTPGDDLISTLIAARHEGDQLTDYELVNLVSNILVGGVDTTQSQLAHALRLLAEHPDQWALLAERPELAPNAAEEALRYEPITPFSARISVEEVEYRGVTFPPDTVVMVSAWNGNRDPDTYSEPDRFDITADRGGAKPLTFGAGIHYCVGANLARAEMQEALAYLAPRMPDLELDGEPRFGAVHGIYGLESLPLRFRA
jgi:cytochrome P450